MQTTYEAEVYTFCQELVRRESLSGQEKAVADLVEREMVMLGYDEILRDELGSVVGVIHGTQPGPRVLFDAHMDVVPVSSPEKWRFGPYSGERDAERIWGRGSTDIKGSLAAALVAIGALPRQRVAGSVIMSASVGEEMIEGLALEHVLAHHPADRVVICEPTGLRLGIGHKGRTGLVLQAQGIPAHSSCPEKGVNAVYLMVEAISRVREITDHQDELLGSGVTELVEIISSPYPGTSMVPDGCAARFDRRLVRGETIESVLAEMRGVLDGLDGVSVRYHRGEFRTYTGKEFSMDDFHAAWAATSNSEIVRHAQRGLAKVGQQPQLYLASYCTNGVASAGKLGLPTIIYGAGDIEDAHGVDESVRLDELSGALLGYRALACSLTGW